MGVHCCMHRITSIKYGDLAVRSVHSECFLLVVVIIPRSKSNRRVRGGGTSKAPTTKSPRVVGGGWLEGAKGSDCEGEWSGRRMCSDVKRL
jgi:hypothetical protein